MYILAYYIIIHTHIHTYVHTHTYMQLTYLLHMYIHNIISVASSYKKSRNNVIFMYIVSYDIRIMLGVLTLLGLYQDVFVLNQA